MQEPKKVQFDIENTTSQPVSVNLFDSSAITNQNVSTSSIVAGTVNNSFVYGIGFDSTVFAIAIQSDNKILVGGGFGSYDGTPASQIIRLNTDGSVDTSFVYGTGFDNGVNPIAIQSDGKIVVGGNFSSYNGTGANYIIRLNSNGSVDSSFVYGTGFNNTVNYIAIQSDDKILVVGGFTTYNGTGANRIIRLNSDGSIDTSFVYGTGFNNPIVLSIAIQSDGKILVGGGFTTYNGTGANGIIRLNTDGSIDTSFVYGTGFDSYIFPIAIQSDGKIVVGGYFTSYNGIGANYIVSLNNNTISYTISGGSVDYNFFVQGLNNDPKKIEEIELIMPQTYLVNPLNVQYTDASGISNLNPFLPNIEIDTFQKATNRAVIKFGEEYVMNINTQIVDFILPPLSTTILVITYTELLKSDMLDMVIYEDEGKAKYKINQSLEGKITAEKYWGSKKMPKELKLSSDWLKEMRKRFKKVEVIEYDQPKLAGGTIQTKEIYQDLFGFKKEIKNKNISITKNT